MNPTMLRLFIASILAITVPTLILHLTTDTDRRSFDLTAPPFGWLRILLTHLVTALPLGWLVASTLRRNSFVRNVSPASAIVVGLLIAAMATAILPGLGNDIVAGEITSLPALVVRAVAAFALILPWCVAFADAMPCIPSALAFSVAVGVAILPSGLYSEAVIVNRTEIARDYLERERLSLARPIVLGLCELGSELPFNNATPHQVLKFLDATLPKLEQAVALPLPANVPDAVRLERVMLLVRLHRLEDASQLLQPLADSDPAARLFLAGIYRDLNRWNESDQLFHAALAYYGPQGARDPDAAQLSQMAYEGIVFNAKQSGRLSAAEEVLQTGLAEYPGLSAFFHYELGRHYADRGRPAQAAYHLLEAARINPKRYGEPAEKLRRSLLTGPYGCLFLRPSLLRH